MTRIKVPTRVDRYYCEDCQSWFHTPHIVEYDESRGEFWGMPCSEHMVEWHCPNCDSESIFEANQLYIIDEEEEVEE